MLVAQGIAVWGRQLRKGLALGIAVLALCAPSASADSPAWSISLSSYPTDLARGSVAEGEAPPGLLLVATDIGGAATSGGFSLTATLPPGLRFSSAAPPTGKYGSGTTPLTCEREGRRVECRSGSPSLEAGQVAWVRIPLNVSTSAPPMVTTTASVEGGGAAAASASLDTRVDAVPPPFSLLSPSSAPTDLVNAADGASVTQAGSHPYELRTGFGFPTFFLPGAGLQSVGGGVRDLVAELPPGLVIDPLATPHCSEYQLENPAIGCPDSSQVGLLRLDFSLGGPPGPSLLPLYNLSPPSGTAAEFGTEVIEGLVIHMSGGLRGDGEPGLFVAVEDIPAKLPVTGVEVTLWGGPSDPAHDGVRGRCVKSGGTCSVEPAPTPFLTMPTSCGAPLVGSSRADSWVDPGAFTSRSIVSSALDGCNRLEFTPSFRAVPTADLTEAPTGADLTVGMPQAVEGSDLAEAALRDATISLPDGLTINPSGADGLAACSPAEIGLTSSSGERPIRFSAASPTCPDAAKIGSAEARTPLIDHPLQGAVYVAEQDQNPFGSPFAIYLVLDDPASGTLLKLAGRVDADPATGRLTASFAELPPLPIEELKASFFSGPRAVLRAPATCGAYTSTAELVPWSSPEAPSVERSAAFELTSAPMGGCPRSEADLPASATLSAGSKVPRAGVYSPFLLRLSRPDGSRRLTGIDARLPAGVSARLAGVERCEAGAATSGTCPPASAVGRIDLGAGSGPLPLRLAGTVYLSGAYRGAPLSLVAVVPAVAGPFDLGKVVVRVALYVDPRSAVVHAVSDPLPAAVGGVPVDLRSLQVSLDRHGFARTPTSCQPLAVSGSAGSGSGATELRQSYQVGECSRLAFAPRLSARLLGPTRRGAHPGLRVDVSEPRGGANLRRIGFTLPTTELLDARRIRGICGAGDFATENCSASSVYGRLEIWSPLLKEPLAGPVFLRAGSNRLPDLAASLRGEVDLTLDGHLDSKHGRLRGAFQGLPDVPLSRAELTLRGGRRGLLVNTGGICTRSPRIAFSLVAHSADSRKAAPRLRNACPGRR
jgi:hypothetical protein